MIWRDSLLPALTAAACLLPGMATAQPANAPGAGAQVRLHITKNTGSSVVPGNYTFSIGCTGGSGTYTGPTSMVLTLPGPPAMVGVPQGAICTLSETPIAGWTPPIWGTSPTPSTASGWTVQIGPMNVNTQLTVANRPPASGGGNASGGGSSGNSGAQVRLTLTKNTGSTLVPGNYTFGIACSGGSGTYTGPSSMVLTLPGPSATVGVPQGAICTLSETPIPGWTPPIWGSSPTPSTASGWTAQVGPMNVNTQVTVANRP